MRHENGHDSIQPLHSMTMTVRTIIGNLTDSYQKAATSTLHRVMVGMVKCEHISNPSRTTRSRTRHNIFNRACKSRARKRGLGAVGGRKAILAVLRDGATRYKKLYLTSVT